ncbi:hypothetical protein HanIR_Chr14g0714661 [Helianthus annuus]|nr:hypothetical protein HanIR_Chr14g0714661 [Helianthus annuus]
MTSSISDNYPGELRVFCNSAVSSFVNEAFRCKHRRMLRTPAGTKLGCFSRISRDSETRRKRLP